VIATPKPGIYECAGLYEKEEIRLQMELRLPSAGLGHGDYPA
jgi:hypothetical protein